MKLLTGEDLKDTYECCKNKQLVWSAIPRVSRDWFSQVSICLSCGAEGHVSISTGRVKTSKFARDFATTLQSI